MPFPHSPMRCIVADDEYLAQALLRTYISQLPSLELVAVCDNAMQTIATLQKETADVLLLDIQMPDLTGLDLLRSVRVSPLTILTTAYSEFAIEGYQLQVIDYLLKPFSFERFAAAIQKAADQLDLRHRAQAIPLIASEPMPIAPPRDYIFVKVDYKMVRVALDELLYVEAMGEYVCLHLRTKPRLIIYQTMKSTEEQLPAANFFRIHKSYIVHLKYIDAIDGNMVEIQKKHLPISKNYRKAFFERL